MRLSRFKTFLIEGTTGPEKWKKYFNSGDPIKTAMKKDSALLTLDGKKTGEIVRSGEEVEVLPSDEFSASPVIRYNGEEYRVTFANVDKPIIRTTRTGLKPDVFGIFGTVSYSKFDDFAKQKIEAFAGLSSEIKDYMTTCIDYMLVPDLRDELLEKFAPLKNDIGLIQSFNKDFMEILGPFFVKKELKLSDSCSVYFPSRGNEPLLDFKLIDNGIEYVCSSKTSKTKTTNVVNPGDIYRALKENDLAKKYRTEMTVLKLLAEGSIKTGPSEVAKFIKAIDKNFNYTPVTDFKDSQSLIDLERSLIKYLNEKLDFSPLVRMAIPDLYYVKGEIDKGIPKFNPLTKGSDVSHAKFRSKNSPNRIKDKIGFQL